MTSCERCWLEAQRRGIEYKEMLLIAEREGHPCCQTGDGVLTEQAIRLRAGQFWDEATKSDRRQNEDATLHQLGFDPAKIKGVVLQDGLPDGAP